MHSNVNNMSNRQIQWFMRQRERHVYTLRSPELWRNESVACSKTKLHNLCRTTRVFHTESIVAFQVAWDRWRSILGSYSRWTQPGVKTGPQMNLTQTTSRRALGVVWLWFILWSAWLVFCESETFTVCSMFCFMAKERNVFRYFFHFPVKK